MPFYYTYPYRFSGRFIPARHERGYCATHRPGETAAAPAANQVSTARSKENRARGWLSFESTVLGHN